MFSKEALIQLFLAQQEQISEIDKKLQLVLGQIAVMNRNRYGRKNEQMPVLQQMEFSDVNREQVVFNEMKRRHRHLWMKMRNTPFQKKCPVKKKK